MSLEDEIKVLQSWGKPAQVTPPKQYSGYRFHLERHIDNKVGSIDKTIGWLMLNPSTADEQTDDPTIRKCIGFTKRWGYQSLVVANLFALRSTQPNRLLVNVDPVGRFNNHYIKGLNKYPIIVLAWGGWYSGSDFIKNRVDEVMKLLDLSKTYCISRNKSGTPKHPLMAKYTNKPIPWGHIAKEIITPRPTRLGLIKKWPVL